ncbi:polysaccharide deacetylase family protein [Rufibacter immobilis]|uniref:polysaccharide deacetylase family protein n=1 Tax=Rufibacter immobilis TaxID=1348778 RepID=UPI0035E4D797
MLLKRIPVLLLCLWSLSLSAQDWNKKKCAVVLTYDDALHVHLNNVVPALDSLKLKGTFFLTAAAPAFAKRLPEWKKVAAKHELANHTLFHPCEGNRPGREFVTEDYNLATYSVRRILDEIKMTNTALEALDGKKERTFAYPCGDTKAGGVSYLEALQNDFVAARGVQTEMVSLQTPTNLHLIGCYGVNGQTGDELIALVKQAMETNRMIVFLFHGVGGEHGLNVSLEAHRQLLQYLKQHEKDIWNPTFLEAAKYVKAKGTAK